MDHRPTLLCLLEIHIVIWNKCIFFGAFQIRFWTKWLQNCDISLIFKYLFLILNFPGSIFDFSISIHRFPGPEIIMGAWEGESRSGCWEEGYLLLLGGRFSTRSSNQYISKCAVIMENVCSCHRLQIVIDCLHNFDQIPVNHSFPIYENSSTSVFSC